MSASPLPALAAINPTPPTSAASPVNAPGQSGASFNTHLQTAQQQQQPASSSDDSQAAPQGSDAGQGEKNKTGAQADSPANGAVKPSIDVIPGATQNNKAASDNSSLPVAGIGSLASTVLGLIDQATNDVGGHAAATTSGANSKPATPQAGSKQSAQQQPAPQPMALAASLVHMPMPPVALSTPVSSKENTGTSAHTTQAQGGTLGIDSSGANSKLDTHITGADAGNGDATTASASTTTAADVGASMQASADSTHMLASSLMAASPAATSPAIGVNAAQSTPDLAALGNIVATAPPVPLDAGGHSLSINAPVGSSSFNRELGQQITWLSGQDIKQAQIRLNPQDLGPLDVKVSVSHGSVDVAFITQHPATTAAVQQGLDQLHQMLGGQGLSLGQTTVGQHAQQQFGARQEQSGQAQASGQADDATDTPVASVAAQVAVGLVDAFA